MNGIGGEGIFTDHLEITGGMLAKRCNPNIITINNMVQKTTEAKATMEEPSLKKRQSGAVEGENWKPCISETSEF